ncbi:MAG: polysaccharide biosynthesis C-terminal domain-containing protein, partial [Candidatus Omnitrophica bacterium]|nr:polysaccharide biosynthesis C-terminal domain-containing protein [Candidatus Omnitrophota bacterium]
AGLAVLSRPMVELLFKRGQFDDYSVSVTAMALLFYSLGLVSCVLIKILVNAFYAMQDTRTPVKTATLCLGVNVILNLVFMWHLKIGGLALATTIAATVNACLLFAALSRRVGGIGSLGLKEIFLKTGIAVLVMTAVLKWCLVPLLAQALLDGSGAVGLLAAAIPGSAALYFGLCLAMKLGEARQFGRSIVRVIPGRYRRR